MPRDGADLFFNLRPTDQVYKNGPKIKVLERFESCGVVKAICGGKCEALGNGPLPVRHTCAFYGSGRNVAVIFIISVPSWLEIIKFSVIYSGRTRSGRKNLHAIEKGDGSSFDFDWSWVKATRLERRELIQVMSVCYLLNKQTKEQRLIASPPLLI